jgi:hypothetical protein
VTLTIPTPRGASSSSVRSLSRHEPTYQR